MSDIISDLYNGTISPAQDLAEKTEDYLFHREKFLELGSKLRNSLDEKSLALFEGYTKHSEILFGIENEEIFRKGFIIGSKMMNAIHNSDDYKGNYG